MGRVKFDLQAFADIAGSHALNYVDPSYQFVHCVQVITLKDTHIRDE